LIFKFYEESLSRLREQKKNAEDLITSGNFDDFNSYKYMAGVLKGFRDAEDIIIELYSSLMHAPEIFDDRCRGDATFDNGY
jgi:hypothetical protein